MGATVSPESPDTFPALDLPVAYFAGDRAAELAGRFSGATLLANFVLSSAIEHRPGDRFQILTWLRRGRLSMTSKFEGVGSTLLAQLRVGDHGRHIELNTTYHSEALPHEIWGLTWEAANGGHELTDVGHQTPRATEHYNYAGAVPELVEMPTDETMVAVSGLHLRAARTLGAYHAGLLMAGKELGVTVRLESSVMSPKTPIVPAGLPGHGSM